MMRLETYEVKARIQLDGKLADDVSISGLIPSPGVWIATDFGTFQEDIWNWLKTFSEPLFIYGRPDLSQQMADWVNSDDLYWVRDICLIRDGDRLYQPGQFHILDGFLPLRSASTAVFQLVSTFGNFDKVPCRSWQGQETILRPYDRIAASLLRYHYQVVSS